jgi:Bacterial archaeo-eukaryotic release factor family 3
MLGDYRREHPSPVVLAGATRTVDRFTRLSRNLDRVAGKVTAGDELGPHDLALECTEVLDLYLRSRREDALARLRVAQKQRPQTVAEGIEECWRSVRNRAPAMLLVEESYLVPGDPQNFAPVGTTRPSSRRVVYDLVDDLMEQVITQGGQLALVKDGDLHAHGRIALIVRETS